MRVRILHRKAQQGSAGRKLNQVIISRRIYHTGRLHLDVCKKGYHFWKCSKGMIIIGSRPVAMQCGCPESRGIGRREGIGESGIIMMDLRG